MLSALGSRRALAVSLALTLAPAASAAERPWVEVKSPNFVVVSNAGDGRARELAWQFEQVRQVFRKVWPWARTESGRRFVVFAVRDEQSLRDLAPQYWEGKGFRPTAVFVPGIDRDYVALRTDVRLPDDVGVNPYSTAYEGYAHIVLSATFGSRLPYWYGQGLGELFGNTVVREGEIHFGRVIPWHLEEIAQSVVLPLKELLATDRRWSGASDPIRRRSFDAQSWAFLHFLVFGNGGARLPALNQYADRLRAGVDPVKAFGEVFGDPAGLESEFRVYTTKRVFQYARLPVDATVAREMLPATPLSPAAAQAVRAGFHAAMRRPVESRALLAAARQAEPTLAGPYEVEGLLLDAEDKDEDARAAFAAAAERNSESFHVLYRLAQLTWSKGRDAAALASIVGWLDRGIQLNPDHAFTYSFLSDVKLEQDPKARVAHLTRRAVALEPTEPYHRLASSRALWAAGDAVQARAEAQRALALSRDDRDRAHAQQMLDFLAGAMDPRPAAPLRTESGASSSPAEPTGAREGSGPTFPCTAPSPECAAWSAMVEAGCQKGELQSCFGSAWAHEEGRGRAKDVPAAMKRYGQACEGGVAQGCTRLALLHIARQTAEDRAQGRALADKACRAGDPDGCRVRDAVRD